MLPGLDLDAIEVAVPAVAAGGTVTLSHDFERVTAVELSVVGTRRRWLADFAQVGGAASGDVLIDFTAAHPAGSFVAIITGQPTSSAATPATPWGPFDLVAETMPTHQLGTTNILPVSATLYAWGGAIVPARTTVTSLFTHVAVASAGLTSAWFVLGVPHPTQQGIIILALSARATADVAVNTVWELSLATASGGTGPVTFPVATPVYLGMVQVATTPARVRGITGSGFSLGGSAGIPCMAGSKPTTATLPSEMEHTIQLSDNSLHAYMGARGVVA